MQNPQANHTTREMPKSNTKNKKNTNEVTKKKPSTEKNTRLHKTPKKTANNKKPSPAKAGIKKTASRVQNKSVKPKAQKRLLFGKQKKATTKATSDSGDEEIDQSENVKNGGSKRSKAKQSWRKLTFDNDLAAVSRVCDDNLRDMENYVDDEEELTTNTSEVDGNKVVGFRNIAAPHGAASVLMKKAFIRTKSGDCSRILNNILKTVITNCAYSTAAIMIASSPGKRRSVALSSSEWTPKRCQTEHLRTVINHETGGTILDIIDDVYKTTHTVKLSTQQSQPFDTDVIMSK